MDDHLLRYQSKNLLFIDCETFNLSLNRCHNLPWQIAMIKYYGEKFIDSKDIFIKWDTHLKISEEAARITQYDHNKVEKYGKRIEEFFPTIEDWLNKCDYIIGHNILGFDIYMIKNIYEYMGKNWEHLTEKIIDTNCLARGIKYGMPYSRKDSLIEYQYKIYHTKKKNIRSSLGFLAKEYNIVYNENELHNAMKDLELNFQVWNKLKWQVEV